jgi:hypothetical protein
LTPENVQTLVAAVAGVGVGGLGSAFWLKRWIAQVDGKLDKVLQQETRLTVLEDFRGRSERFAESALEKLHKLSNRVQRLESRRTTAADKGEAP